MRDIVQTRVPPPSSIRKCKVLASDENMKSKLRARTRQ